ncbi:MAG: hypothetical protein HY299_18410 [Verrucomicrobia bacterium]|nr:hypothetical protein [Verrucomicrobiota bacterium]
MPIRTVPSFSDRPSFLSHARLRRCTPITHYVMAAALEALGKGALPFQRGEERLGILVCLMSGCVSYSRRFHEEVMSDPAAASPLIFPETVFNAPGSHLSAFLNSSGINYTLVGDDSTFLQGLAVAAGWLLSGDVDGCLVVGAEEMDWPVVEAMRLFTRASIQAAGAGALYLRREPASSAVELLSVTDAFPFSSRLGKSQAAIAMRAQLPPGSSLELLVLGTQGLASDDAHELEAWAEWTGGRIAPKRILGAAFAASAAWQCVYACDALVRGESELCNVSVVGATQQAIGARFFKKR